MRLTKYWTATTEEAYGMSGMKGRYGEVLLFQLIQQQNIPAQDYEDDRAKQLSGVDIETPKFSIDVKSNLEDGVFFVEVNSKGWLFNPSKTSDLIVHIDIATKDVVWYYRSIAQQKFVRNDVDKLAKITPSRIRTDFMYTSLADLFDLLKG